MRTVILLMYHIKMDIYQRTDIEVKASNMVRPKALTFAERNKTDVERIVQEMGRAIPSHRVFSVVREHPEEVPDWIEKSEWLPGHYRFLLQRINGGAGIAGSQCVMAFDSQDEGNDQIIVHRIKHYLFRSTEGRRMTSMVETAIAEGIQIADLIAGIIRQHHEHRDTAPPNS